MSRRRGASSEPVTARLVGSLFGSFVCLMFIGVSLFIGVMLARDLKAKAAVRSWIPVESTILRSEGIEERSDSSPYRFAIEFTYTVNGRTFSSDRYSIPQMYSRDYSKIQRLIHAYPEDSRATALVNPASPAEAVLKQPSLASAFVFLFLLPFFLGGLAGLILIWKPSSGEAVLAELKRPATAQSRRKFTGSVIFFGFFLLAGLLAMVFLFIRPLIQAQLAGQWPEVPCTIISSEVRRHSSDDGATYSIDILYEYEIAGTKYRSNRYNFIPGSSSGYKGKRQIVSKYRQGTRTVCYVNPHDRFEAVLSPGLGRGIWLGLVPLIFIAVGGGGIYFSIRAKRKPSRGLAAEPRDSPPAYLGSTATTVSLKGRSSPVGSFIASIVIAGFWNGIVSLFVGHLARGWKGSGSDWFMAVFLLPFASIGLVLIGCIGYTFFALFSPRGNLRVNSLTLPQGAPLHVEWRLSGRTGRITRLEVSLEGREETIVGRGKSGRVHTNVICLLPVVQMPGPLPDRTGKGSVIVPKDKPATSEDSPTKIIWCLRLKAKVDGLPDLSNEFRIRVLPA